MFGQWHLSFKVSNDTRVDRPDLKFDGYCLTALAYQVEIESSDGKAWRGSGRFNFDQPLSPGWSQELNRLDLSLGSRPKNGNLTEWRITKTWGFALNPEDRPKVQNTASPPPPERPPGRVRVAGGVQSAKLIWQPKPSYPDLAKAARIEGTVRLDVVIGEDGTVQELTVVSGHPLLIQAAMDAVKQWRYRRTMLNGIPVEVATTVDVNFVLGQ